MTEEKKDLGVLVGHRMTVSHLGNAAIRMVNEMLGSIRRGIS